MTRQHWTAIAGVVSALSMFLGGIAAAGDSEAPILQGQRHVRGTVEQIKGEQLQLDTGEMTPRFIPMKAAKEKGFPEIKIGDVIELTLNDQNLLVDYHLLDKSGQPVGHTDHQILKGQIAQPLVIGHDRTLIRTEDGKETSYRIRTQARSKMASIPVGVDAVFMVDETSQIVDVNFASKEAAERAGQMPEKKSPLKGAQQRILGTVITPLQENRITIRTRDGQEQHFEVRPSMRKRMAALPKGEKIVLLLDGDNQVADVAVPPGQKHGE
jgi:translation initiation factor IF-1